MIRFAVLAVALTAQRFGRVPRAPVHTSEDATVSPGLRQRMRAATGGARPVVALKTSHMPTQPHALADAIVAATP